MVPWRRAPRPRPQETDEQPPPCIVHLARAANGLGPYRAFLEALRSHPPGIECQLALALKGFAAPRDVEPYLDLARELVPELRPEPLLFADQGLDIGVYMAAATRLQRERYCFLNSYSEPLAAGWLAKLDAALAQPHTGLAGATGSWASVRSRTAHVLGLPSAYRGVLPKRRVARKGFALLDDEETAADSARAKEPGRLRQKLHALRELPYELLMCEGFPAPHLRTNGFMISHATLSSLKLGRIRSKRHTYMLEHGRRSITNQVLRAGLRALVVDAAGETYDVTRWNRAGTFWQGDQAGLLIADNQTRRYARGDGERRSLLGAYAWGAEADPTGGESVQAAQELAR
jgi:hypothetical protein